MADSREIVIKLVVDSSDSKDSKGKSNDNVKEDGGINLTQLLHPVRSFEKTLKERAPVAGVAFHYAFNAAKSGVMYALNRNFSLKEDYQSEVALNNTFAFIGKLSSAGSAIGAGAMIGGPFGAAVAAVGWVGNEIVSAFQKYDQQQISLNEMNYQSTFQRTRMGLIDGGRGTEN